MNKYVAPKAEMLDLAIVNVIMASATDCEWDSCNPDDGSGNGTQGASLDTQALV